MDEPPFKERVASRKFLLMLSILVSSTTLLFAPVILRLVSGVDLFLITGGEYVSLVLGAFAIYSGANVFQKRVSSNQTTVIGEDSENRDS